MKNILIVYIATGKYNRHFDGFISSLSNFCPGVNKCVSYLTDEPDWKRFESKSKEIRINRFHIDHMPWPLVTLLKFNYIHNQVQRFPHVFTHACYFNANVYFNGVIEFDEFFDESRLSVVRHWTGKGNAEVGNKQTKSISYLNYDFPYIQADIFGGPIDEVRKECEFVMNCVQLDLSKRIIPTWDDESYHNYYLQTECRDVRILPQDIYNCFDPNGNYTDSNKIILRNSDFTEIDKDPNYLKEQLNG